MLQLNQKEIKVVEMTNLSIEDRGSVIGHQADDSIAQFFKIFNSKI